MTKERSDERGKLQRRTRVVWLALGGNLAIAIAKFVAAALTGSSAMASEGVHSLVDTSNEVLLLYGLRRASAPPDADHPFGHGREIYFWSFIVALLIFALGAGVSLYEGVLHLRHPAPLRDLALNYAVLGVSCVFEGVSWHASWRELRRSHPGGSVVAAIRRSKDPSTFTVFLEDSVALAGLVIAGVGIGVAHALGRPEADALASILIAALLGLASIFLARETKALLIGEPAHPQLRDSLLRIAAADEAIAHANGVYTAQLGPDRVLAALSAEFRDGLATDDIERCVRRLERAIREAHPDVVALFVKPQPKAVWAERVERLVGSAQADIGARRSNAGRS
ncbi:MAG TPA: cation diffusion facilitator family transporter [Dokdonella sp.]|nr:cation diffusion facilitator family transporter [Dokdonella sp.]